MWRKATGNGGQWDGIYRTKDGNCTSYKTLGEAFEALLRWRKDERAESSSQEECEGIVYQPFGSRPSRLAISARCSGVQR
jgi:hypothetical protein